MAVKRVPLLEEGYYLDNFLRLISFVKEKYADILSTEEKLFIGTFKKLSSNAQRLYVRLVSRQGDWYRLEKLNYPEIEISRAVEELVRQDLISMGPGEDPEDMMTLFTRADLTAFLREKEILPKGHSKLSKAEICLLILEEFPDEFDDLLEGIEIIGIWGREHVDVFRLLFFGNLEQTLSDFILEDIGVLKYEPYRIRKKDRFFRDRLLVDQLQNIIDWQVEHYLAREAEDSEEVNRLTKKIAKISTEDSFLLRKINRSLNHAGYFFERKKDWETALRFYKKSTASPSRERRVRILEKTGEFKKALKLCQEIEKHPWDESESEFLEHFPETIKRRMGVEYRKNVRRVFLTEDLVLPREDFRVEELTVKAFEERGYKAFYTENHLYNALFGLVFWDIVFAPKPSVFFNPFQRGPIDLYTEDFFKVREKEFRQRIRCVQNTDDWKEEIMELYRQKKGTANYLINWKKVSLDQIKKAIKVIPNEHMTAIFRRMSQHLRKNSSGFPDLFVCDVQKKQYKLVEVKGPGDQLQASQKRWLKFFEKNSIPYSVVQVNWK